MSIIVLRPQTWVLCEAQRAASACAQQQLQVPGSVLEALQLLEESLEA